MERDERRIIAWLIGVAMATLTAMLLLGLERTSAVWQEDWSQRLPWLGSALLLAFLIGLGSWMLAAQVCRLRRSEATYRDLVENVNSIVLRWRADGTITFINDYGLRLLGYSREELLGRSVIGTIVPQTESSGRDLAALMDDIAHRPEKYIKNENENICRDGRRLWISWSNRPLLDRAGRVAELLSIGSDHSRRRKIELALKQSEARFRTMVSHLHGAIYRCRVELPWKMEFVSEAIGEITGYPAADFMEGRRNYAEVVHPADRDPLTRKVEEATAAGRPFEVEYRILTREGVLRWVHERGQAVVVDDGDTPWLDGVIFDISARKEAESQLIQARDVAKAASQAKSNFLANMSHELRTPLNAIIGYSEILLEDAAAQGQENCVADLEKIRSAAGHLLSLITEVLDFSKVEAGKVSLGREECDLTALLEDVVDIIRPLMPERGNRLLVEVSPDLGSIQADPTKIRQVLYNLAGNAAKFTENGFITLRARRLLWEGAPWVQFDIQDTGIGISEEQQALLFQPFIQADESITRKFGGTGLGLAISRYFCRMMGGDITVSSVPEVGSTFTVALPVDVPPPV